MKPEVLRQGDIQIEMKPVLTFSARFLGVTALYVAAAKVGLMYAVVGSTVTLLWAPSGIALAALLLYGWRMAFAVALGAFLANSGTGLPFLAATPWRPWWAPGCWFGWPGFNIGSKRNGMSSP